MAGRRRAVAGRRRGGGPGRGEASSRRWPWPCSSPRQRAATPPSTPPGGTTVPWPRPPPRTRPSSLEVEITGAPRRLRTPGRSGLADRWAVPGSPDRNERSTRTACRAQARLLVMGGAGWEHAAPGQRLRTTGKLKPAEPGQAEAAVLSASSAPLTTRRARALAERPRRAPRPFHRCRRALRR